MTLERPSRSNHDFEQLDREARRWARTRWANIPPSDRDDVVQDVLTEAWIDVHERGFAFEQVRAGVAMRVKRRGIDAYRASTRRAARSLDETISDELSVALVDTIAIREGDPHEALELRERLRDLAPHVADLRAYLAVAPERVRIVDALARSGVPRQNIVEELHERGMTVSHAVVRKIVSRDLIGRFPELRFLWENRAAGDAER